MTAGSTAILHSGNQAHKDQLLAKIGGSTVLHKAVDLFYGKLLQDPRLEVFFRHANITVLKWHQFNILSYAFTAVPDTFDIEDLLLKRHKTLFEEGMCETHFDYVMEHFETTLQELNVEAKVIAEAKLGIAHIRDIFVKGALEAQQRKIASEQRHQIRMVILVGALAAAAAVYWRRRRR